MCNVMASAVQMPFVFAAYINIYTAQRIDGCKTGEAVRAEAHLRSEQPKLRAVLAQPKGEKRYIDINKPYY